MSETARTWGGPLAGLRVIDLTRVLAGPLATQLLGDLGAEIIKVEPPGRGDETRGFAPFIGGESHYFIGLNRGKRSVVLDLRKPEGADILRQLVGTADVIIENFRPGVMDRLGLGANALMTLNPRLIYCAISGFGLTGRRYSASIPIRRISVATAQRPINMPSARNRSRSIRLPAKG